MDFVVPVQKGEKGYEGSVWDDEIPERARTATLDIFANDDSASVQVRILLLSLLLFHLCCIVCFLLGYAVQNGTTHYIRKCVHTDGVLRIA